MRNFVRDARVTCTRLILHPRYYKCDYLQCQRGVAVSEEVRERRIDRSCECGSPCKHEDSAQRGNRAEETEPGSRRVSLAIDGAHDNETHLSLSVVNPKMEPENKIVPPMIAGPANLWVENLLCCEIASNATPLKVCAGRKGYNRHSVNSGGLRTM